MKLQWNMIFFYFYDKHRDTKSRHKTDFVLENKSWDIILDQETFLR